MFNPDFDVLWKSQNFPDRANLQEQIQVLVRQDLDVLIAYLYKYFLIILVFLVLRFALFNISSNSVWVHFYDTVFYGLATILLTKFAYKFHNYYLSFYAITNLRIISIVQSNLVFCEIVCIPLESIDKIKVERKKARDLIGNRGSIELEIVDLPITKYTMSKISDPELIYNKILELRQIILDKKITTK